MIWVPEHLPPYALIHSCWMFCWNVEPAPDSAPAAQSALVEAPLVLLAFVELSLPQAVRVNRLAAASPASAPVLVRVINRDGKDSKWPVIAATLNIA